MKKKILMISVMIASCMFCAGCGGAADPAAADDTDRITEAASDTPEEETVKAEDEKPADETTADDKDGSDKEITDYEAVYEPVFKEVLEVVNNGYDHEREYTYVSDGLMEKIMYPGDKDLRESVGYIMEDLSGDNVPELLIGSDENWGDSGDHSYIYSIFSIKDEKPVSVVEGWARSSYSWLGDGHFYYCGSGGAAITIFGENHLSEDGCEIIWDDFYFTDEKIGGQIGMYHNTSGMFDVKASEEVHVADDVFFGIMEDYEKKVKLIPWIPIGSADKENVFSYHDTIFSIDGHDIDVRDQVALTDRIMDAKRIGDWIILDCHVNPHFGIYEFYNINSGGFEYEIQGANLIWHENDLSTAVYSNYNQVFDFWGHLIGWVDEGEVFGLEWIDYRTVGAKCRIVDEAGREKEFTREFEYTPADRAVLSYYEYLLGGERQWVGFKNEATYGSVALVIINPPKNILDRLHNVQVVNEQAYDRVVVVSLEDGETLHIDTGEVDASGREKNYNRFNELNSKEAVVYQITVPEGPSNGTLMIRTQQGNETSWDVATLSGQMAVMSTFI